MLHLHPNDLFAERYRLRKRLGQGGFSEVWLAYNETAGFEQAVKIYTGVDEQGSRIFRKEFARAYHLTHSNLLRATEFSIYEDKPYLVMPYCRRGSAYELLGKLGEKEIAKVMRDVGGALAYIHHPAHHLVHRDIKPDNIMLGNQGEYLLSDFGISSELREQLFRHATEKGITTSGEAGMTPVAYRAPEYFSRGNDDNVVMASDIWAFGATLYELATGERPFGQLGGGTQYADPEPPELPRPFSRPLSNILKHCLAKEPWARPSADNLRQAAEEFLRTGQWPAQYRAARRQPAGKDEGGSSRGPAPYGAPGSLPKKTRKGAEGKKLWWRGRALAIGLVALVILIGGSVGLVLWPGGEGGDKQVSQIDTLNFDVDKKIPINGYEKSGKEKEESEKIPRKSTNENSSSSQMGSKDGVQLTKIPPSEKSVSRSERSNKNPTIEEQLGINKMPDDGMSDEQIPDSDLDKVIRGQNLEPVYDIERNKYGYRDKKTWEWVIPAKFEAAGPFKNGRARVTKKGTDGEVKSYYVDPDGNLTPVPS